MIKLTNVENKVELELTIEGYQFPDSPEDDWCLVKVSVKQNVENFNVVDPALESKEMIAILDWFKCLAARKLPRYAQLSFTEPCLAFQFLSCRDDSVRIAICLSHEMKPDFDLKQFGVSSSEWCVIFDLRNHDFNEIISSIEASVARYPVRGQTC
jgi:hypothetical protein